jgi:hypothetical protein
MEYKELIVNAISGEITERPYTKEEIAFAKQQEAEADNKLAAYEAEITAKATAKSALLEKLGITAEEAVLLLS